MQLASYLEGGPLMWMMHLHVNIKSDYDDCTATVVLVDKTCIIHSVEKCHHHVTHLYTLLQALNILRLTLSF